jgi:peptidoglycan/LPS O-acetylase OafA/YrhL
MNNIYLPGLNGIRTIAASIVVIFHVDQFSELFQVKSLGYHKTGMAGYAVVLFFVLSGFLITHLLLLEKEKFGKVDLPKFYVRRILRIWPIYYLAILIAIVFIFFRLLVPDENTVLTFSLYSLLLSNVGYALGLGMLTITPLWSIGVEEQFYAFWPLLVNKSRDIGRSLIAVIIIYFVLKICARFIWQGPLSTFVFITSFDSMAIGGLAAYLVYKRSRFLTLLYTPVLQVLSWIFLIVSIVYKPFHVSSLVDLEIHSCFYAIIILNVSTNSRSIVNLENGIFNYLGKISYGLYVYHMIVICLLSGLITSMDYFSDALILKYIMVYVVSPLITIVIASLSYKYFEQRFLMRKAKYSNIHSTNVNDAPTELSPTVQHNKFN